MLALLFIPLFFLIYFLFLKNSNSTRQISLQIGDKPFSLEVASTVWQQAKGLSGRPSLCPNCGMLFVFPESRPQTFWMKDTLIPLDMLFLDESGQIVTIHTANPEPETPNSQLKKYSSEKPTKYVIELNAGQAKLLNLTVGQTLPILSTLNFITRKRKLRFSNRG
jgi:uncharacterized membrane protein (UPF0127 family)